MNQLAINKEPTMSSLEIAKLVESRHDKVKQSIERLAEKGIVKLPPVGNVKNNQGQTVKYYELSKRDSYVVVAQLSPGFTARLVDRWQELESQQIKQLPQTYISALEALVEAEKQKEALRLELDTTKIQLDESMEWSSLKRMAHFNGVHWDDLSWQLVKKCSFEVGRPPYKIFDANYDAGVNNYHITAWAKAYPELKFPEPLEHK